jgi:phage gp29-like protein
MTKLLDQYGRPIDRGALKEPQTQRIAYLQNRYLTSMIDTMTPARLAVALRQADEGNLTAQHRLYSDMEERDLHMLCEINKRKLAVMDLDWDIIPPRNPSAAEKSAAEWLKEVLTDAVDPIEDMMLALMDGVFHGFAAVELEWRREGNELLPAFFPRPQEWFRLDRDRRELRLIDASADGAPLIPFGWVLHTHGKPKTGYLGRMGLHRALVWPYMYKSYSLADFADFLDVYGLPIIVGKYGTGAEEKDKADLMRAVTALGHDARAIMPAEMILEIQKVTADGSGTPHLSMVTWADRAESQAILGQTLSSEAQSTGLGSGVADVHNEVRNDIRNADARQIAGTLTRDLLYPLLALNRGGIASLARCPRFVFDTGDAEDLKLFADALPKLVSIGMRIDPVWAHEKLKIPQAAPDAPVLTAPTAKEIVEGKPEEEEEEKKTPGATAALRAATPDVREDDDLAGLMADEWERVGPTPASIDVLAAECKTLEEFRDRLPELVSAGDDAALVEMLARGLFAAHLAGRVGA